MCVSDITLIIAHSLVETFNYLEWMNLKHITDI